MLASSTLTPPQRAIALANLVHHSRLKVLACDQELNQVHATEFPTRRQRRQTVKALHQKRQLAIAELEAHRQHLSQALDGEPSQTSSLPTVNPDFPSQREKDHGAEASLRAVQSMIHSLNQWIVHANMALAEYGRPDDEEEALRKEEILKCIASAREDVGRWKEEGDRLRRELRV